MTKSKGSEFENSGNKINYHDGKHHKRLSVMPSLVVIHPIQLPAGWNLTRSNNTSNNIFKARLSILIRNKT
jgi:hypothetical protein